MPSCAIWIFLAVILNSYIHILLSDAVQKVLLMDEISTGLDSATTYTVTEFLRTTTHYLHLTTLVSLLQPPPEVYNLFDDVILLSDG